MRRILSTAIALKKTFIISILLIFADAFVDAIIPASIGAAIGGLGAAVAGSGLAIELYARLPQKVLFGSRPRKLAEFDEADIVLIFPGAGGPDKNTGDLAHAIHESDKALGINRYVHVYDWSTWRGNLVRASYDGQSVGKIIGTQLAQRKNKLSSVHVVGVSVGAFAADSCARAFQALSRRSTPHTQSTGVPEQPENTKKTNKAAVRAPTFVRLTLLDPFCSKGVFGQRYGELLFGKHCDYCEHYLNTDDPVPFTNTPLPHACTFDVTDAAERRGFTPLPGDNMHSWPVAFYGRRWKTETNKDGSLLHPTHEGQFRRGAVIKVP
jgi:hypothetical protein